MRNRYDRCRRDQRNPRYRRRRSNGLLIGCIAAIVVIVLIILGLFAAAKLEEYYSGDVAEVFPGKQETLQEEKEPLPGEQEKVSDGTVYDFYYYYDALPETEREIYDSILNGINHHDAEITLDASAIDSLESITAMIQADHPELFWIDGSYRYRTNGLTADLQMTYLYDQAERAGRQSEVDAAVAHFMGQISETDTEYEKIRKAYEFLIDSVDYVAGCSDNQNLYSSLVNHESVCAGYARANQYLLQQMGIQAIYVSGTANGANGWENHGWNIVRCDGQYYQVDVTFGDTYGASENDPSDPVIINYIYLCCDDSVMYRNHTVSDMLPVPVCSETKLNYFILENRYADVYDDTVYRTMKDAVFNGEHTWSYQFSNYEACLECLEAVRNSAYSNLVSEYLNDSSYTRYTYDEVMYYIVCWY